MNSTDAVATVAMNMPLTGKFSFSFDFYQVVKREWDGMGWDGMRLVL